MGGSSLPGYSGPSPEDVSKQVAEAFRAEQERVDRQVDEMLQGLLARFNRRDTPAVTSRMKEITSLLEDVAQVDTVLFGGSTAKHTAIDGLSDVDALVILDREDLAGKGPRAMLNAFEKVLDAKLPRAEVTSIEKGPMAVTITYVDGTEIQLLPALRRGQVISIANVDGRGWNPTKPQVFHRKLTRANERMGRQLVPVIKLFKAIREGLAEQKRVSGYHAEALAIDAARSYRGPKTLKGLLLHVLDHAAKRVLRPIGDPTGQSRIIDGELGREGSIPRRSISQALLGVKRRLEAARTVAQWKAVFDD